MKKTPEMAYAFAELLMQKRRVPNHYLHAVMTISSLLIDQKIPDSERDNWHALLDDLIDYDATPSSPAERFQPLPERLAEVGGRRTISPAPFLIGQGTQDPPLWKGAPLLKSVWDIALFQELLFELKPTSIVELGSGSGASAQWYSDLCGIYGFKCSISSFDIHTPEPVDGVNFIRTVFPQDIDTVLPYISDSEGPCLIIEDMHVGLDIIFNHIVREMRVGDYLIIEDSSSKQEIIKDLSRIEQVELVSDNFYLDRFGRNGTSAMNSILKRIK